MGVNISQYKIVEDATRRDGFLLSRTEFDYIRYTGDREIASTDEFEREWLELGDPRDECVYWRPKDIDATIEWCRANLPTEGSKVRWITEFEKMKTDKTLYFYNGW